MTSEIVHFSADGDFIVGLCRDRMLSGQEDLAFKNLCMALIGMGGEIAEKILEGDWTLKGSNSNIELDETPNAEYKEKLRQVRNYSKNKKSADEIYQDTLQSALDVNQKNEELKAELARISEDEILYENSVIQEAIDNLPVKIRMDNDNTLRPKSFFTNNKMEQLDNTIKAMMEEPVYTLKPHVKWSEDDLVHYHWFIAPDGDIYKVPYQDHEKWMKENIKELTSKGLIKLDVEGDIREAYLSQGWVRVSGGTGMGVSINCHADAPVNRNRLMDLIMTFAMTGFTCDIVKTAAEGCGTFELAIDYRRMKRLLNQNMKGWK